jgi:hypothetical protein
MGFFRQLDREFHFTLDPCANTVNAKCRKYFTPEQDGLAQSWQGEVVFMNPPFGPQGRSIISRLIMECNPDLNDVFRLRKQRVASTIGPPNETLPPGGHVS